MISAFDPNIVLIVGVSPAKKVFMAVQVTGNKNKKPAHVDVQRVGMCMCIKTLEPCPVMLSVCVRQYKDVGGSRGYL